MSDPRPAVTPGAGAEAVAVPVTDPLCHHGEGPAWSPRWAGVRWVDMLAGSILELRPSGDVVRREIGGVVALVRARREGGWIVATERGIARSREDDVWGVLGSDPELWADPTIRANEGACAPDGDLYLGTMAYDLARGRGFLLRIDAGGRPRRALDGVTISNGLAWSADGSRAFYVDTAEERIDVFDWTATDGLIRRRPWTRVAGGGADGIAIDADGGVWTAIFGGSEVRRYDRDGKLDVAFPLPVSQPTALCFAGDDLTQLYVTTSRYGLPADAEPQAGSLFRIEGHGRRGLALGEYAG